MPSTTDKKISATSLFGKESNTGKLARIVTSNKKEIKINARKITILKNLAESNQKRWSGDTMSDKLPGGEGLGQTLNDIANNMDSIKNTIIDQQRVDKGIAEDERKAAEKASRGKQEKDLESNFTGLKQTASKVLAPVKSVWEKIINFITTIFLGKIAMRLFEWFADKENEKKVKAIGKFLKDWWPAILAGFLIFGNSFTSFAAGLVFKLGVWAVKLTGTLLKQLLGAAAKLGGGGVGGLLKTGAVAGIAVGGVMLAQRMMDDDDPGPDDVGNRPVPGQTQENTSVPGQKQGMSKGGTVRGSGNKDTVPAMLTPGEFVMSAPAVQKWGVDTLEGMNAAGGGTNKPKQDGGVTYAAGGGLMGGMKSMVGGVKNAVGNMLGGEKKSQSGALKGLSESDYKDLAFIVSGEAQRGTDDEYGVAANVLNRVADPRYPDTIKAVGAEPGQYEAVFKGKAYDDPELAIKLASPAGQEGIVSALERLQGRTDFKGTSQYKNMGKGDVKFSSRGNFYHYAEQIGKSDPPPTQIPTHWKKFVGSGGGVGATQSMSTPRGNGGSASISGPPPPVVKPPGPKSSVAAYNAQQKGQAPAGQNAQPLPSSSLPEFDAAIMNSQAKIKVLGITV